MSVDAAAARELLVYMLWADRRLMEAVRQVRDEDLSRESGVSFGSMLGTLAHTLGSQRMWLSRFQGIALERVPSIADFPDRMSWILGWEETAAQIEAFLAALTDEQLAAPITWTTTTGKTYTLLLWQPLIHLVNHASYHRGQVVSLLRQMGYTAISTDLIAYYYEQAV